MKKTHEISNFIELFLDKRLGEYYLSKMINIVDGKDPTSTTYTRSTTYAYFELHSDGTVEYTQFNESSNKYEDVPGFTWSYASNKLEVQTTDGPGYFTVDGNDLVMEVTYYLDATQKTQAIRKMYYTFWM